MKTNYDEIIQTYHCTRSVVKTRQQLRISTNVITAALNSAGIERYAGRKYDFDQSYFDQIDTPEKAYFLGFLWVDGNNHNSTISLCLASKDRYMLDHLNTLIGSKRPLYCRNQTLLYRGKYKTFGSCTLTITSKSFSNKMSSIGLIPNKTDTLRVPFNHIPQCMMRHFIRGCFDGDGCISIYKRRGGKCFGFETDLCAKNLQFAKDVQQALKDGTGVEMGVRPERHIYSVYACSLRDQSLILDWLYKDTTIYLKRKYERYLLVTQKHQSRLEHRSSRYRFISIQDGRYTARKTINGKSITFGRFLTEQEALQCLIDQGITPTLSV